MRCQNKISVKSIPSRFDGVHYRYGLHNIEVPCGTCPACLQVRQDQIKERLLIESRAWPECLYCTWTYRDEDLPKNASLSKDDAKKMLQDLKNALNREYGDWSDGKLVCSFKYKYYLVGEYGEKRDRPHVHLILFLPRPVDWHIIQRSNMFGNKCDVQRLADGHCAYVAKYTLKEVITGKKSFDYSPRERPFKLWSNGIGASIVGTRLGKNLRKAQSYQYRDSEGYLHSLSRYQREKLFNFTERQDIAERIAEEAYKSNRKRTSLSDYNQDLKQEHYSKTLKKSLKQSLL